MDIAQMEIQARCDRDEIRRLREENARLTRERDEARVLAEARAESLEACMESDAKHRAEVARLEGLIVRCFGGHYEGEANAQLEVEARRIRGEK